MIKLASASSLMIKYNSLGKSSGNVGALCNGSTADFESVCPGSIPGAPV